ncbi:cytidylyltransferase (HIGH family) exon-1 [Cryptosporidium sp. chipmunk genotype I]|uniref:cytidylyltransferase (HIGH family) exon-1 n=1 Tax=Cryptosporidium sp. chipmunk genotype I TaxID=1280935 RepID=UPI003519E25B|nr:cytidylyltransferase (HIGH family) exon-1 [Cryptosporidium sp. chipmunk genotype I]
MSEIESGFLILDPQWWIDVNISDSVRHTLFKLLYSCVFHTSHSLFIYYSVLPQGDDYCHEINISSENPSEIDGSTHPSSFINLTYKHINSIVKAYEIALDVIETLNKIPTFDIRFIPVKNDCLNHIYKTMGLSDQTLFWSNSFKFCEKHGNLVQCANIINDIFSCICRKNVYYINFNSESTNLNSMLCKKYTAQLISQGFKTFEVSDNLSIPLWKNQLNTVLENDNENFFDSPINRTLFAGTFDRLHPGHKVNITVATWYAKELVIIGITDKLLNANKSDNDIIQDFSFRSANVHSFIFSLSPDISVAILRISSIVGGADIFEFDALIATPESYNNAAKINDLRLACGSPVVKLVKVPFVYKPLVSHSEGGVKLTNGLSVKFCSTGLRHSLKQNLDNPFNLSLLRKIIALSLDKMHSSELICNDISAITNMIFSFIDDIIFEILYEWRTFLGDDKGRAVFEKWFGKLILELEKEGKTVNSDPVGNGSFISISKYLTFILIYLISSLNLIKKNKVEISHYVLNKMYSSFNKLLIDGDNKEKWDCENTEFCVPYIFCYSDVENNIFFRKAGDIKYSEFKYQFGDLIGDKVLNLALSYKSRSNNVDAYENYYLTFEFVKKRLNKFFQVNEIESRSFFQ